MNITVAGCLLRVSRFFIVLLLCLFIGLTTPKAQVHSLARRSNLRILVCSSERQDLTYGMDFLAVTCSLGFRVESNTEVLNYDTLKEYDILILSSVLFFDRKVNNSEIEHIMQFVEEGGGLLLIGEMGSATSFINPLSERFGVSFAGNQMYDPSNHLYDDRRLVVLHDLLAHPITLGVDSIYFGQATSLLVSGNATALAFGDQDTYTDIGNYQGKAVIGLVAAEYGKGRAVFIGSIQRYFYGFKSIYDGIREKYINNQIQLLSNIFHWVVYKGTFHLKQETVPIIKSIGDLGGEYYKIKYDFPSSWESKKELSEKVKALISLSDQEFDLAHSAALNGDFSGCLNYLTAAVEKMEKAKDLATPEYTYYLPKPSTETPEFSGKAEGVISVGAAILEGQQFRLLSNLVSFRHDNYSRRLFDMEFADVYLTVDDLPWFSSQTPFVLVEIEGHRGPCRDDVAVISTRILEGMEYPIKVSEIAYLLIPIWKDIELKYTDLCGPIAENLTEWYNRIDTFVYATWFQDKKILQIVFAKMAYYEGPLRIYVPSVYLLMAIFRVDQLGHLLESIVLVPEVYLEITSEHTSSLMNPLSSSYMALLPLIMGMGFYLGLGFAPHHPIALITTSVNSMDERVKRNIHKIILIFSFILALYGLIVLASEFVYVYRFFKILATESWLWILFRMTIGIAIFYVGILIFKTVKEQTTKWKREEATS